MKFRSAILGTVFLLWATQAFGQSCSMCYSNAKATSKEGQTAISKGVVVLLFPPLGFMTLGVWMAFRYAKKRDVEQNLAPGYAWSASEESVVHNVVCASAFSKSSTGV
jgi:hypothetical protein